MYVDRNKDGSVVGRLVKERRSGIDRRKITYDYYIPERRIPWDRRQGNQCHGEWLKRKRA